MGIVTTLGGRRQCGNRDFCVPAPFPRCQDHVRDLLFAIHLNVQAHAVRISDLQPIINNFAERTGRPNNMLKVSSRAKSKRNAANLKPFDDSMHSECPVGEFRSTPGD